MNIVKVGKKGQVSIPAPILRRWGMRAEGSLLAEVQPDGALLLRPATVLPLEIYSDARIAEFMAEDERVAEPAARYRARRKRRK